MTPFEFAILLHYYGRPNDLDEDSSEVRRNPPILEETMRNLVDNEFLRERGESVAFSRYLIAPRGECYVRACLDTPWPEWTVTR